MGPRWRALLCAAATAAIVLSGCRKSENESAREASAVPQAALHPPFGFIDSPKENEVVESGFRAYGWALDDSGVGSVTVSLDSGPALPVELGQNSPAVKAAYPMFPSSDKAGFVFTVPPAAAGPHLLVVTITARDGGKTKLRRHLQIK